MENNTGFDTTEMLKRLRKYLPDQAPLKDFVHHNTLHAFQNEHFHDALSKASRIFGYRVYLNLEAYRKLSKNGKISQHILRQLITREGMDPEQTWYDLLDAEELEADEHQKRIGSIRSCWKEYYKVDLDTRVHTNLFRILGAYLDQGIASWTFPVSDKGILASLRLSDRNTHKTWFHSKRVRTLLQREDLKLTDVLEILVGNHSYFESYCFDQQFAHPGWSGMVQVIEQRPDSLLAPRRIKLEELLILETLLEIDVLDDLLGTEWKPVSEILPDIPGSYFAPVEQTYLNHLKQIWQEAYEWTYYEKVLRALKVRKENEPQEKRSFQALLCMDDREGSMRRTLEEVDSKCETYGTPGHFNLDFYFLPEKALYSTKTCPVSVTPRYLIREEKNTLRRKSDLHFSRRNQGVFGGFFITNFAGWLAPVRLALNIINPEISPLTSSSQAFMSPGSSLSLLNQNGEKMGGLQVGYTYDEMTDRLEELLRSIGLVSEYAPLIYTIGHGATSVNNPHYAGYNCGACSGRPGSVNARLIARIGNNPHVRSRLKERGIFIPDTSYFIGALHDTSRDELTFFDTDQLPVSALKLHERNLGTFNKALKLNARERSRRFMTIDSSKPLDQVYQQVKRRAVSLFEPRPELNHATNALAIVGRRTLTNHVFLDRRAFLNSYDPLADPQGTTLGKVLSAVIPVAGGINLEYYFSRVDRQQLGAGSKLPHNVVGLLGVSNGIEGDLRTGLPYQMTEVHDPIRILLVVEHEPEIVLKVIRENTALHTWIFNEWMHLVAIHPESKQCYRFNNGIFERYEPSAVYDTVQFSREKATSTNDNIDPYLIL